MVANFYAKFECVCVSELLRVVTIYLMKDLWSVYKKYIESVIAKFTPFCFAA